MRPIHALPVVLVAVALVGCGGGDDDNGDGGTGTTGGAAPATQTQSQTQATTPARGPDGAEVFASAGCGGCHALAAADSSGAVGPDLDDLRPDFETTRSQVENGGGGMPAFGGDLSQEEIDAVSRFVADSAGQ
ncbi:MAG TPA: cytochrome c [Conexibacter sp.]|nr:cytochrome c [Conexibacter sp.]